MNWSDRTVNNKIKIDKLTISEIIHLYVENKFYVNRRYQRKLVWSLTDKRLLIDSITTGIPIPALLLVNYDVPSCNLDDIFEIVDGLQRINAIVSFAMGDFGIKYEGKIRYFDPMSDQSTFSPARDNSDLLTRHPDSELLPKGFCEKFCWSHVPIISTGKDDATVELIFSRINSTGRKIASHDFRQSRAVGEFPDLVRRIASDVRHDNTYSDHILLSDMPKISVGEKEHGYGVDINTVFWRRHDLITNQGIKESKDEEIIEILLANVLLDDFRKNKDNLDKLYQEGTELNKLVNLSIKIKGKANLEDAFKKAFDAFDMIFNSVNSDFSSYLFTERKTKNKDTCFIILFLALYRLISEGYCVQHFNDVAKTVKQAKMIFNQFTAANSVDSKNMRDAVDNCYGILKTSFTKEVPVEDNEMTAEIDRRLGYSKVERQMTEFKIGVSNFTSSKVNKSVIHDVAKTLVAMSNTTNATNEMGFVIVGVADSKQAYDNWHSVFGDQAIMCNHHYVPGVTREACKLYTNTDQYYRALRQLIENEPISDKLKQYVLESFEPVTYRGAELIVFKSKNVGETSLYNGVKYVRRSNETVKCPEEGTASLNAF